MRLRRRGWTVLSLAAALLAGSFAFTYWVLSQDAKRPPRLSDLSRAIPEARAPSPSELATIPRPAAPEVTLRPDARIVRRTFFTKCGNEVIVESQVSPDLVGATRSQLAQRAGGAVIEEFDAGRAVLQETREASCPKHAKGRYLGVADGHLAVFEGEPGGGGRAVEVFDLPVTTLPDREVQDLHRGVPVASDTELQRMLQSYLEQAGY